MPEIVVKSPNVIYTDDYIEAHYDYQSTKVQVCEDGTLNVYPKTTPYVFRTKRQVPRLGVMLVGWGGNNGTTVTGSVIANKLGLTWNTKNGVQTPNYFGSITQSSTVNLGTGIKGDIYVQMCDLLPMVKPDDIIFDGWDISSLDLGEAMRRASVFDYNLQKQLYPHMKQYQPRPSIYIPDFIAANQSDRADNVLSGTRQAMMDRIRTDIREFKSRPDVDVVIILWTANTERFSEVQPGVNDTSTALVRSIQDDCDEISPSTIFAVSSILEGVTFINGSPQNTFVPGVIELAEQKRVYIGGDDFKSGQTKVKSVLADFLVSAGIKLRSIVSYNHLGNNDGRNLSVQKTFRSKEVTLLYTF